MRTIAAVALFAVQAASAAACGEGAAPAAERTASHDAGSRAAPAPPSLPRSPVVELVVGWYSVVARLADGSVWYWGHWLDREGQAQARPIRVELGPAPESLAAAASHAYFCALGQRGARCLSRLPQIYGEGWGDVWALDFGASPPEAGTGGGLRQITIENYHGCALAADGTVWCWGVNARGQLGNGRTENSSAPVRVVGLDQVEEIGTGHDHGCARRRDRSVWCWGSNERGQLGDPAWVGPEPSRARPVPGVVDVVELAVANSASCARLADGRASCWGDHIAGEAGTGARTARAHPAAVPGVSDLIQLEAGGEAVCGLRRDGRVLCWGHDQRSDALGPASNRAPHEIPGLDDARLIAAGTFAGCAVRASGAVACWGSRRYGQLGDGETEGSAALSHVRW